MAMEKPNDIIIRFTIYGFLIGIVFPVASLLKESQNQAEALAMQEEKMRRAKNSNRCSMEIWQILIRSFSAFLIQPPLK